MNEFISLKFFLGTIKTGVINIEIKHEQNNESSAYLKYAHKFTINITIYRKINRENQYFKRDFLQKNSTSLLFIPLFKKIMSSKYI